MPTRILAALLFVAGVAFCDGPGTLSGQLTDPQGQPVADATVGMQGRQAHTASDGRFSFSALPAGEYKVVATAPGFVDVSQTVVIVDAEARIVNLQFVRLAPHSDTVTATADVKEFDIENPDPAQRVSVREEILDANPGRPGAPVSIPGLPVETASGGIKAPQYFAPGVAGDHGEPIAMFIQVGSYLLPNNLSANAHGNGYSDPNMMVPAIIESVETDGGAFNVREGNHAVDMAATYAIRPSLQPFATLTADYRDVDVSAGWRWLAVEASYGNGFLDTPEHRRQYKINALKGWSVGAHQLTFLFIGY